jgi:flagellar motor switch protein FliG
VRNFAFDDIVKLEDRAIQRLLKEVDAKTLVMALTSSTEELMGRILRNMGSRAGMIIREEIGILGPQRVRDVESAQREIVETVLALAEGGFIVISPTSADGDRFI